MNDLLDRVIGKPTQYVKQDIKTSTDMLMQNAMQELRNLSKEDLLAIRNIVDGDAQLASV
jgi:hypothetical protein